MFSPYDSGVEYPLFFKRYHARSVICDASGRELFIISVVRPSREAFEWLEEWGKEICNKFNNGKLSVQSRHENNNEVNNGKLTQESVIEKVLEVVKKKRGRPRKNG